MTGILDIFINKQKAEGDAKSIYIVNCLYSERGMDKPLLMTLLAADIDGRLHSLVDHSAKNEIDFCAGIDNIDRMRPEAHADAIRRHWERYTQSRRFAIMKELSIREARWDSEGSSIHDELTTLQFSAKRVPSKQYICRFHFSNLSQLDRDIRKNAELRHVFGEERRERMKTFLIRSVSSMVMRHFTPLPHPAVTSTPSSVYDVLEKEIEMRTPDMSGEWITPPKIDTDTHHERKMEGKEVGRNKELCELDEELGDLINISKLLNESNWGIF